MDTPTPGDINANGAAFLGHTQIAAAFLGENATTLTPIQMLTSGTLNHRPQLAPTNEGAMAVWVNNPANVLVGDATHRDALMFSRYNQGDETWSAPAVAVANVPGLLDYAFAAYGTQAAVLFLTDMDNNPATTADVELYSARYQSGVWAAPVRVTTNTVAESSPEFVFVNGAPRGVWRTGNQFFFLSDWAAAPTALPFAAAPLAGNFRLVALEDGDLTLLWTESESGGQQLYRALFTTAASAWSLPQPVDLANLGGTPAGQGAIASLDASGASLFLDGAGAGMMIAYTEAAVGTTTRTLPAFNGTANPATPIPQMPVLGKRTLRLAYVPLETNLRIVPADIVVTPATQQVGGLVTVSAIVRNTGLYALQSVTATLASFPVSNPAAITPIGTQTIPLLAGGASSTLQFTFARPAAADRLYVVTVGTPDSANVEESTYGDNTAYVGTDALVVGTGPTAYAGSVASPMVVLRQQSALPVPASMEVGIRLGTPNGPLVGGATALLPVAASQSVTVSVPVSAAALGAGRHTVYVDVDPEKSGGDWNPDNDLAGTTIVVQPDLTTLPLLAQQSGSTFRVWVRNEGNWPSVATTLAVFDRPRTLPGAVQIASVAVPALQPGQMVKVEGALGAAGQAAEVATIAEIDAVSAYAVLDPANKVVEINENNNAFLLDAGGTVIQPPPANGPKIYLPIVEK